MLIAGQPGTGKTAAGLVAECSGVYQGIDCWIFSSLRSLNLSGHCNGHGQGSCVGLQVRLESIFLCRPFATGLGFEKYWGQRRHLLLVVCYHVKPKDSLALCDAGLGR